MSTLQARHRGHNIPDGVTTFNEIEYDREGGVFLNKTKLILLIIIVFLLTAFSAFIGRYTAERQFRQKADSTAGVAESQIPFLAVEPESYKVRLEPKLYAADGTVPKHDVEYEGRVEVIFRPKADTSVISLHVGRLKIGDDAMLKRRLSMDTPTERVLKDDSTYEINTEVNTEQETLIVTVSETLKSGHYYSLFVNFSGTIGQSQDGGFFKVVFDNKETVKNQWYVATKLAPNKARHLLPCVDNPKHKAIFEMSVVRNKETKVIFNTKVRFTEDYNKDNGLLIDHFEKTGLMRPDSLTLFMTNIKSYPIKTPNSFDLTVWSPGLFSSINTITDMVPRTLEFMTSYLVTTFPYSKLDILVVPDTVMSSLTESPGLIVIKDSVLGSLDNMSMNDYQKYSESVVSAVIRQWLMPQRGLDRGNNEDKWLNEALVNFLKIITIDHIKNTWKLGASFSLNTMQPSMFYDSWTNSEPLVNYEHHTEIYDYISAGKGTAILRMLNDAFTEDIFKQTVQEFVHTEIYKNKDAISFWTLLDDNARNKSGKLPDSSAVLEIVNTWVQNKNYPLVKLQVDGDDLIVKQFRFDYDDPKPTNDWVLPITLTSGMAYSTTVWLENIPEIRVPGYVSASKGSWILANQQQTGYYRVAYEDVLLDRITYAISNGNPFDVFTVAQLVGDIVEGAFAGVIGFTDALAFVERVVQMAGPSSGYWKAIFNALNRIETVLHSTRHYDSLSIYMEMVVEKAYNLFQVKAIDSPDGVLGRISTLRFANQAEFTMWVRYARMLFSRWKRMADESNPISPNDRDSVYCSIMQYATKDDRSFLLREYEISKWALHRKSIVKSFSCSKNQHFLQKLLSVVEIKYDDLIDIWQAILDNPTAGPYAFNYLRNNWETMYEEYSDSNVALLSTMMHAAIRGLNSLADLEMMQSFVEKYFGSEVENRNPALLEVVHFEEEVLRQKITWREKYEGVISSWLEPKSNRSKPHSYILPEQKSKSKKPIKSENAGETKKPVEDVKTDGDKINDEMTVVEKEDSSVETQEKDSSVVAEEKDPSAVAGEKDPSVMNGEKDPSLVAEEKDPSAVAGGKDPSAVAGGKDPSAVAGGKDPSVMAGEKDQPAVAGEKDSSVVAAEKDPSAVTEEIKPPVEQKKLQMNKRLKFRIPRPAVSKDDKPSKVIEENGPVKESGSDKNTPAKGKESDEPAGVHGNRDGNDEED